MPTLAELFPNLAKLKKDDSSAAAPTVVTTPRERSLPRPATRLGFRTRKDATDKKATRNEATHERPTREEAIRKEASRDATLRVGGPTRGKRSNESRSPSRDEASVREPAAVEVPARLPEPVVDSLLDANAMPAQERCAGVERRSGAEARAGRERRYGVEARSGSDRRASDDPRSGEDMRSGGDRRSERSEPSGPTAKSDAGFSPLASAARFAIGKVSGGGRSAAPARSSAGNAADAPAGIDAAVSAPATKRSSRRPSLGGGAPNIGRLGSLGSLKNVNVGIGRRGKRGASLVGLDIQPGYVAAVESDVNGVVAVKRAVGLALPPNTMRDGEVIDETLLTEVLHELFAKGQLSKRVRVGLANQRTVVRTLELPPIEDRKELAAAVNFQAQDQIPMPLANAVLDFQPLGIVETPNGRRQRVVVVAAQREMVQRLVSAVSAAGLRPEAVDLSAFAMIRALYRPEEAVRELPGEPAGSPPAGADSEAGRNDEADAGAETKTSRTLFLNVGGLTNLAIAEDATCRFTRAVGGGLESMAGALAERRAIPLVDARALIASFDLTKREARAGGLPGAPLGPTDGMSAAPPLVGAPAEAPTEQDAGGAQPAAQGSAQDAPIGPNAVTANAEARAAIAAGLREIAGEVRNSLDYHRAQESGGTVDRVVVSGAALEINGFASALEAELGFRVQRRSVASSRGGDLNGMSAERLAVAAGLGVEEVVR